MPQLRGLPPIDNPDARVLILGSMPGGASLRSGRYYAHRHNRFWRFMQAITGIDADAPYDARVAALRAAGIAVWDVLAACEREGSLDSAIRGEVANDLAAFLSAHPALRLIAFNGAKAEQSFMRHVAPSLGVALPPLRRLPSTSPANASQGDAVKLAAWRAALCDAGVAVTSA